jgi:hypothetical protein
MTTANYDYLNKWSARVVMGWEACECWGRFYRRNRDALMGMEIEGAKDQ